MTATASNESTPRAAACGARARGRRWVLRSCFVAALLTVVAVFTLLGVAVRIAMGPVDLGFIAGDIANGIARSLGPDHRVRLSSISLQWAEGSPRITVYGLEITRTDGAPIASAPRAYVGLGLSGLLAGRIEPVSLAARSPALGLTIRSDGSLVTGGPDPTRERARPTPAFALIDPDLIARGLASGSPSSGGALRRVSLEDVTVTIRDERSGIARTFGEIDVEVSQLGQTGIEGLVSAAGARGRWRIAASVEDAAEGRRPLTIAADGVTVADLAGPEAGGLAGLTLALRFEGSIDEVGRIERLRGAITLAGDGVIEGPGWQAAVAPMRVGLQLEPERRVIELAPSLIRVGDISGRLSGRFVVPAPGDPTRALRLNLAFAELRIDASGEPVPEIDRLALAGSYEMVTRTLWIERAEALGPSGSVAQASAQVLLAGPTPGIRLDARAGNLAAASVRRIWPAIIAREAQEWFVENVSDGHLERAEISLDVPPGWLDGRPLQREMYRGVYRVRDGTVRLSPELPPITGVSGIVRTTGTSVRVEASGGRIEHPTGAASLPTIVFTSEGMDNRLTAVGVLEARAEGNAGALLAIGDAQGLPVARGGGIDTRAITGDGTADIRVTFPIFPGPEAPAPTMAVQAELRNVTGRGVLEGRDLERGTFRLTTEGDSFAVEGTATVLGMPARLSARQDGSRRLTLRAEVDTDDASRTRLGFNLAPHVTGAVPLRLIRESVGNDAVRRIEADLTQARLHLGDIAFDKPRGVPASLSMVLRGQNRVTGVDDVNLQGRGFALRGRARLNEDGTPNLIELSDVRLRAEDNFNARVELGDNRMQVRITGRQIDLRPFLRNALSDDEPPSGGGRLDLSLRVDRALGHHGTAINDMRLELSRTGPRMTELSVGGSFGGATRISGEVLSERGRPYLRLISTDAGAALRFLDLYRNMRGGRLTVTQTLTDPAGRRSDGVLYIEDFRVVGDEGLERLFGAAPQDPEGGGGRRPTGGDVTFDRLRVVFSKAPGTIQLSEGVLRNMSVGITFEGRMDSRRQAVDLRGVFIPAFALNNFLARIPVVGAFMGGQNEGLIGVTYAVAGPLSGPTLRINPVSAIAPGFLRQIFAFPDQPTGQIPQRRAPTDAGN